MSHSRRIFRLNHASNSAIIDKFTPHTLTLCPSLIFWPRQYTLWSFKAILQKNYRTRIVHLTAVVKLSPMQTLQRRWPVDPGDQTRCFRIFFSQREAVAPSVTFQAVVTTIRRRFDCMTASRLRFGLT